MDIIDFSSTSPLPPSSEQNDQNFNLLKTEEVLTERDLPREPSSIWPRGIERDDYMLFLSIFTFDAAHRGYVIEKHAHRDGEKSKGIQVHMELVDLSKNRIFRICEVTDAKAVVTFNEIWSDLGKIETVPVIESSDLVKIFDQKN